MYMPKTIDLDFLCLESMLCHRVSYLIAAHLVVLSQNIENKGFSHSSKALKIIIQE
jgi:hypothetical protein